MQNIVVDFHTVAGDLTMVGDKAMISVSAVLGAEVGQGTLP